MVTLLEPGERERTVDIRSSWLGDLTMWLRVAHDAPDPRGWALLLFPERVDPACRFPDATMHVYQSLRWSAPMPSGSLRMATSTKWVSRSEDAVEIGVETSAGPEGQPLASSLTVARMEVDSLGGSGAVEPFGTPATPPAPDSGGKTTRGKHLVFTEGDLADFMRLLGDVHPLHSNLAFAHQRGHPNVLVQGHVQMLTLMTYAGVPTSGTAEAWFRHPVPVGAALSAAAVSSDSCEVWTLRQKSQETPATIMRISR